MFSLVIVMVCVGANARRLPCKDVYCVVSWRSVVGGRAVLETTDASDGHHSRLPSGAGGHPAIPEGQDMVCADGRLLLLLLSKQTTELTFFYLPRL